MHVVRLLAEGQAVDLAGHDEREADLDGDWGGVAGKDWVCGFEGRSGVAELAAVDGHAGDFLVGGGGHFGVGVLGSLGEVGAVGLVEWFDDSKLRKNWRMRRWWD